MSDIINSLREAVSNPEKAKEALASLQAQMPSMTEEQKAQATQLMGQLKDQAGTLSEEAKTQISSLIARFSSK